MEFLRVIGKNNEVYTKLGEFCLSEDGQKFCIICHACQKAIEGQDKFWRHMRDAHNLMHGPKQEQGRTAAQPYIEAAEAAATTQPNQPIDYTEMSSQTVASNQVPSSMANLLPQELQHKQHKRKVQQHKRLTNNRTTASANSAMSSDDDERFYICSFENCGLKFKYQSRLELHRSVHNEESRFACEICGASFKQPCNLSTHRERKMLLRVPLKPSTAT